MEDRRPVRRRPRGPGAHVGIHVRGLQAFHETVRCRGGVYRDGLRQRHDAQRPQRRVPDVRKLAVHGDSAVRQRSMPPRRCCGRVPQTQPQHRPLRHQHGMPGGEGGPQRRGIRAHEGPGEVRGDSQIREGTHRDPGHRQDTSGPGRGLHELQGGHRGAGGGGDRRHNSPCTHAQAALRGPAGLRGDQGSQKGDVRPPDRVRERILPRRCDRILGDHRRGRGHGRERGGSATRSW